MTPLTVVSDAMRKRELGAFLRSRRERLTPAEVGLPAGARRRTPGLRREEVALIAGVGGTWYTWLEQGRDVKPSAEVLAALAEALRLDAAERHHLYILAGRAPASVRPSGPERVEAALRHTLASLTIQPAYVIGRRWDVLAWNRAAAAIFGDYGALEGDARNIMHLLFTDLDHRRMLVDWEDLARVALGRFRAESAKYIGDPDFERLIAKLDAASQQFRAWWPARDVIRQLSGLKAIRHPIAGAMTFEHMSFSIDDGTDMKLVVYTPLAADNTVAKTTELLDATSQRRQRTEEGERSVHALATQDERAV